MCLTSCTWIIVSEWILIAHFLALVCVLLHVALSVDPEVGPSYRAELRGLVAWLDRIDRIIPALKGGGDAVCEDRGKYMPWLIASLAVVGVFAFYYWALCIHQPGQPSEAVLKWEQSREPR